MIGWFLIWGVIYCLYLVPLFVLLAIVQAYIEEKYILEKGFVDGAALFRVQRQQEDL